MTEPEKPAATEPVKTRTMFVRNTDPKGPMVIPIQVPIVEKTKPDENEAPDYSKLDPAHELMARFITYDKKFCQGTIGFGAALVALIIPVSLIVVGYCYIHECPAQSGLPEWMLYYGILILIVCLAKAVQIYLNEEAGREGADLLFLWRLIRLVLWIVLILMHLIGIWLVFYVWSIENAVCNYYLQLFALFMLILTTIVGVVGLSLKCCGTWFAIAELTNFFHDPYINSAKL